MADIEKVISQLETDYRDAEHRGWILVPVSRRTVKDVLALLKEQQNRIKVLRSEIKRLDVDIVRCKNCKHKTTCEIRPLDERFRHDWFCADGKRK